MFSPYSLLQKRLKVDTNCAMAELAFVGAGVPDRPQKKYVINEIEIYQNNNNISLVCFIVSKIL